MLFCRAYPVRKMVPLDRLASGDPCLGGDFQDCPIFRELSERLHHCHEQEARRSVRRKERGNDPRLRPGDRRSTPPGVVVAGRRGQVAPPPRENRMELSRRTFIKVAGAAGAAAAAGRPARAAAAEPRLVTTPAVLVDGTRCVGCRACEAACSESNHLAEPAAAGTEAVFSRRRTTDPHVYTVVNRFQPDGQAEPRYVKSQCMHCVDPACASACLAKALEKTAAGPVVYHPERCLGCRYCMVACPFDVPKFDFDTPDPYIRKCSFCAGRQAQGLEPACASVCPTGALQFGRRADLARGGADPDLPEPGHATCTTSTARPRRAARAGCTSPTCRSRRSGSGRTSGPRRRRS